MPHEKEDWHFDWKSVVLGGSYEYIVTDWGQQCKIVQGIYFESQVNKTLGNK